MHANDRSKVLVVGGAGYIGSHTAKLLSSQGYKPIILDDLSTGHRAAAKYGKFYEGSFFDSKFVEKVLRSEKISTVMHFGAKALVGESMEKPLFYYVNNVSGTIALLSAMKNVGVRYFVFSSTCATFGEPATVPIHERIEQKPVNPYGQSKFFVEKILRDICGREGIFSAILRYFNAAGADPEGELGEDHNPESHLIPNVLKAALHGGEVTVFGNDYKTRDGSCIRDYVHVNDLAIAHIQAMELLWKKQGVLDFNLGTEAGHSVFEVIDAARRVTGSKIPFKTGARRAGDPATLVADSTKASCELEWKPQYGLDQIIQTTYDWMKKHPHGYEK